MEETIPAKDIKDVIIITIQQTSTGFNLFERSDIHDKFSFSKTGSLKIDFKNKPFYKGVDFFDTYLDFLLFNEPNLIFTKPYDKVKAFEILLKAKKEIVDRDIEGIDYEIKSLEYKKSLLQEIVYKKSD